MSSEPTTGTVLSHYRIVEPIGAGGMGVVFRAIDTRLNRTVALKLLKPDIGADGGWLQHGIKEARAASAFTHPNIVTIHEVDAADGTDFIVMEFVSGRSLEQRLRADGLPIDDVLTWAEQIASALEAAHAAGIVHRDIKPANVMVSESGHVKVLDFGIAKQFVPAVSADAATMTVAAATKAGLVIGSLNYMSPEQAQGKPVDGRSDVFSFGVVLYEALAGRLPFSGTNGLETLAKILQTPPPALEMFRQDVPRPLAALVQACLEKDRDRRPVAEDIHRRLAEIRRSRAAGVESGGALRKRSVVLVTVFALAAVAAAGGFWWVSGLEVRAARRRVPATLQLAERYDFDGFYRAARVVVPLLPDDPQLKQAWINMTAVATFDSNPTDAEVWIKGYSATNAEWIPIGRTPFEQIRVPFGLVRAKVSKGGYAPLEVSLNPFSATYTLDPIASVPDGMVHVPSDVATVEGTSFQLPAFWMDRFEVTNRQFKTFIEAGGYRRREFWKEPFVKNDRAMAWDEAMGQLLDKTGRPGPSTWELGSYLDAQADYPVSGVSWHEAAAYAAFVGKSLPTAFQWRGAGGFTGPSGNFRDILTLSNFGMKGPSAVGSHQGLAPWGTYDMAGNVKEWCWNQASGGRMILGGGWNEPTYMFDDRDAQPPFQRLPSYGFRLVRNIEAQPPASYDVVRPQARYYAGETPVSDSAFAILRSLYQYDPQPLDARAGASEDTPDWRRETVTFDAAYGGERITAYLYLPRSASPPHQTVIYFPGGDAPLLRSSRELRLTDVDFVVRSGRALVYPVYQGTYERRAEVSGPNGARDVTIARVKDVARVIDFIETRTDLDRERIGFYGVSIGAFHGVILTAIEPRVKASVLLGGGLVGRRFPSEMDPFNFAPRVRVPTLMVNGRNDFTYPVKSSQLPLFRLLGVSEDRKRHALFEGGHLPDQRHEMMREILDWFDRYLGPVNGELAAWSPR